MQQPTTLAVVMCGRVRVREPACVYTQVTLLVALPFKQHTGTMNSFGTFFLCGLPGGLNYVLLVLVKEGRLSSLKQKHWDAHINTW